MNLRRNLGVFFGLSLGLLAVLYGLKLEHLDFNDLLNLPAALIVFGGSIGAALIEIDLQRLFQGRGSLKNLLFSYREPDDFSHLIERLIYWGKVSRSGGLLSLEKYLNDIEHPLLRTALTMMIDGYEKDSILSIIDDYHRHERRFIEQTESFF